MRQSIFIFFVISIGLILLIFSCKTKTLVEQTDNVPMTVKTIPFTEISRGSNSNHKETSFLSIDNSEKLADIFKIINSTKSPGIKIPHIDFENESLLTLFMGEKNTGGYKIEIDRIYSNENTTSVFYKEITPSGMVTQIMTQPFYMAKINKVDQPIVFVKIISKE